MPKTKKNPSAVSAGRTPQRLQERPPESRRGGDAVHHLAEAAPRRHRADEHRDRRQDHQGALEDVGVDAGHHPAGDAVEKEDGEAEAHRGRQAQAQHRREQRPHRQELRPEIADRADQDRHRRRSRGRPAAIAGQHGVRDRVDLPHLGEQAQPLGERPGQQGGREADRQVDEQRRQADPVGQSRAAEEDEAAERRRHGGEAGHHHPQPLARHPEVVRAPRAAQRPDPEPQADREVDQRRDDDQRAIEDRHLSSLPSAAAAPVRDPPPAARAG